MPGASSRRPWRRAGKGGSRNVSLLLPLVLATAVGGDSGPPLHLTEAPPGTSVSVDGRLDEDIWQSLPASSSFRVVQPDTMQPPPHHTSVRFFYTPQGLYIGADMEQPPDTLVERLSPRDQGYLTRDAFTFNLDTSGEGRYGFWFQVALGGSLSDGTLLPEREYSSTWDGAWRAATARTDTGWTAELFVPWAVVNMPRTEGKRRLGFFGQRSVAYLDERWGWPALPWSRPKFISDFQPLALEGVNPRHEYAVVPYASSTYDRLAESVSGKVGVDLRWRPSSDLRMNATLNPDFGNVEADDVIVNLSAFETFYPEKRLFFQEDQEIFVTSPRASTFRRSSSPPFLLLHTRRIGAPPERPRLADGRTEEDAAFARPTELLGAAKMTGQRGGLRWGFLAAMEDETAFTATDAAGRSHRLRQDGRDFEAVRVLYERTEGPYRALGWMSTHADRLHGEAHVQALDGHFQNADGSWRADAQLVSSDVEDTRGHGGFVDLVWAPRQGLSHQVSVDHFDPHLELNDMGYLYRNDLTRYQYRLRTQRSDLGWVKDRWSSVGVDWGHNAEGERVASRVGIYQSYRLHNQGQVRLRGGFDAAGLDDRGAFGAGTYEIRDRWDLNTSYESDSSRRFSYELGFGWGDEPLEGGRATYQAELTWRPTDRLTFEAGLDYVTRDGWLLYRGDDRMTSFEAEQWIPRWNVDYFPSARQQFRVAFQWVGVHASDTAYYRLPGGTGALIPTTDGADTDDAFTISELALQVRYRWELAPMSDLFVVYTRHASLPNAVGEGFADLFSTALDEPIAEQLVVKVRYRLGT